ncbi:MAG TPA: thioesterase, partial [Alphaproteobacteria bacterium]|nr:thioesterase [Alphaproteobacteria bacterium]
MSNRPEPNPKHFYPYMLTMTTRWNDQDIYGHMNNMVYGEMFDTVVNRLLIEHGILDFTTSTHIGLAVA